MTTNSFLPCPPGWYALYFESGGSEDWGREDQRRWLHVEGYSVVIKPIIGWWVTTRPEELPDIGPLTDAHIGAELDSVREPDWILGPGEEFSDVELEMNAWARERERHRARASEVS